MMKTFHCFHCFHGLHTFGESCFFSPQFPKDPVLLFGDLSGNNESRYYHLEPYLGISPAQSAKYHSAFFYGLKDWLTYATWKFGNNPEVW